MEAMNMKYYPEFTARGMVVREYDERRGVRNLSTSPLRSCVAIYNGARLVDRLFDTLDECIHDLGGYSKPVELPDGTTVVPSAVNFPNNFDAQCEAIGLYRWHPGIVERWPGEY